MLKKTNIIENDIADFLDIFPDAIGRNFFLGCFLSESKSIQSFKRYIELEIRLNTIKAAKEDKNIYFSN